MTNGSLFVLCIWLLFVSGITILGWKHVSWPMRIRTILLFILAGTGIILTNPWIVGLSVTIDLSHTIFIHRDEIRTKPHEKPVGQLALLLSFLLLPLIHFGSYWLYKKFQ